MCSRKWNLLLPLSGVLGVSEEGSGLVQLHLPQGKGPVMLGVQGANGLQTENLMGRTLPRGEGVRGPKREPCLCVRGSPLRLTHPALPPTSPAGLGSVDAQAGAAGTSVLQDSSSSFKEKAKVPAMLAIRSKTDFAGAL